MNHGKMHILRYFLWFIYGVNAIVSNCMPNSIVCQFFCINMMTLQFLLLPRSAIQRLAMRRRQSYGVLSPAMRRRNLFMSALLRYWFALAFIHTSRIELRALRLMNPTARKDTICLELHPLLPNVAYPVFCSPFFSVPRHGLRKVKSQTS